MDLVSIEFQSYEKSIAEALDAIAAHERLAQQSAVLIKPNLVNASPHPITTSPVSCEAIIKYVRRHSKADVVIAEGCGDKVLETTDIFERLGYTQLSRKLDVPLVDLNHEPLKKLTKPECIVFPEMYLPKIAFTHYIISVPVLKRHSLAMVTGTLKNMMGFAPPRYYSGRHGTWKKAVFHGQMQESLIDLNSYLVPHLSVMDCTVGMAEYHLGGRHCNPPVNKILAAYNPWELDREAAKLLGLDWKNIDHIAAGFSRKS